MDSWTTKYNIVITRHGPTFARPTVPELYQLPQWAVGVLVKLCRSYPSVLEAQLGGAPGATCHFLPLPFYSIPHAWKIWFLNQTDDSYYTLLQVSQCSVMAFSLIHTNSDYQCYICLIWFLLYLWLPFSWMRLIFPRSRQTEPKVQLQVQAAVSFPGLKTVPSQPLDDCDKL